MPIFKKIIHRVNLVWIVLMIVIGLPVMVVISAITNGGTVKGWLVEADAYGLTVDGIKEAAQDKLFDEKTSAEINKNPLIDERSIFESVASVLNKDFLKSESEGVIDGWYGFLNSDTDKPVYTFSLAKKWPEVKQAIADRTRQAYDNLPECAAGAKIPTSIDKITCKVPGYTPDAQIQSFVDSFEKQEDNVLVTGVWTGDDVIAKSADDEEGIQPEALPNIQKGFGFIKVQPVVWAFFFVLAIVVHFITARYWNYGIRNLGIALAIGGALLSLLSWPAAAKIESVEFSTNGEAATVADKATEALFKTIGSDLGASNLHWGLTFLGVGLFLALFAWLLTMRGKNVHTVDNTNPLASTVISPGSIPKPSSDSSDIQINESGVFTEIETEEPPKPPASKPKPPTPTIPPKS